MTNGHGNRRLTSWIESFIEQTANVHSPKIYQLWTAISVIGAVLEQRVWVLTSRPLHPNMYIFIIGHPGVGKTRIIREGRNYAREVPDFHLAPTSMTFPSLVDFLEKSKRAMSITQTIEGETRTREIKYNSAYICVDELGAFINKYDSDMIDGLSAFYDPDPYHHTRRTGDLKIKIASPQISVLLGSTPQNLLDFLPEKAWGQGFTSRLVMVFSDERIVADDFAPVETHHSEDLQADLNIIAGLYGQFEVTKSYQEAVLNWRNLGEIPIPAHPKLLHYISRRKTHLYKLSMISAIDRSNSLILTRDDFNRAMGWLLDAEKTMPDIFSAGVAGADAAAIDEIIHNMRIADKGNGISEQQITRFARNRIPLHSILRVVEVLERSGQIYMVSRDKRTGIRTFKLSADGLGAPLQQ